MVTRPSGHVQCNESVRSRRTPHTTQQSRSSITCRRFPSDQRILGLDRRGLGRAYAVPRLDYAKLGALRVRRGVARESSGLRSVVVVGGLAHDNDPRYLSTFFISSVLIGSLAQRFGLPLAMATMLASEAASSTQRFTSS
jgi:hypothetical protein